MVALLEGVVCGITIRECRGGSASPAGPAMTGPLFFNNGCGS